MPNDDYKCVYIFYHWTCTDSKMPGYLCSITIRKLYLLPAKCSVICRCNAPLLVFFSGALQQI